LARRWGSGASLELTERRCYHREEEEKEGSLGAVEEEE
jgi:hypothetical protein